MVKYDIVRVPFPYSENEAKYKYRPALVLDSNHILTMTAKITGSNKKTFLDYEIRDWKEAGLSKPSVIQLGRKIIFDNTKVIGKIGHLSEYDIAQIKQILSYKNIS